MPFGLTWPLWAFNYVQLHYHTFPFGCFKYLMMYAGFVLSYDLPCSLPRGKNVVHQLPVTLEEMYNGATRKLSLQKNVICDRCDGRGGKKGAVETCPNCRGSGMQIRIQQLGPGFVQQIQSMCDECRGQGERINPRDRCKQCNGKKVRKPGILITSGLS